jgi:hypothetical protein
LLGEVVPPEVPVPLVPRVPSEPLEVPLGVPLEFFDSLPLPVPLFFCDALRRTF